MSPLESPAPLCNVMPALTVGLREPAPLSDPQGYLQHGHEIDTANTTKITLSMHDTAADTIVPLNRNVLLESPPPHPSVTLSQ